MQLYVPAIACIYCIVMLDIMLDKNEAFIIKVMPILMDGLVSRHNIATYVKESVILLPYTVPCTI